MPQHTNCSMVELKSKDTLFAVSLNENLLVATWTNTTITLFICSCTVKPYCWRPLYSSFCLIYTLWRPFCAYLEFSTLIAIFVCVYNPLFIRFVAPVGSVSFNCYIIHHTKLHNVLSTTVMCSAAVHLFQQDSKYTLLKVYRMETINFVKI